MERKTRSENLQNKSLPLKEIEQLVKSGATPGCSISIITNTGKLESTSFGYLDDKKNEEVTPHTVYDLASISKLFTTAIILKLHEQEKLSIDDPCSKYLKNFSNSRVTLLNLLTHQIDFGFPLSSLREKCPNKKELLEAILKVKAPKTKLSSINYGNLEFIYLGMILENIENKDLNTIFKNFFQELDLEETYTGKDIKLAGIKTPPTEIVDGQVVQDITHDETSRILGGVAGHAGIFSSSKDLAKFGMAWMNNQIIKTSALEKRVFQNYNEGSSDPQAIGWWMRIPTPKEQIFTPNVYSHTGFTGPLLTINTKTNAVCAFTCNRTYYGRNNFIHKEIWELLTNWIQD